MQSTAYTIQFEQNIKTNVRLFMSSKTVYTNQGLCVL